MPATRETLFKRLDELGIAHRTIEHPAVFTVAESAAIERDLSGGHTKNLFLKDAKGRLFLVVAESHTRVDLKTLPKAIGSARLSFANAELLAEVLGVAPGSVTLFALLNDTGRRVSVVVEKKLMSYDSLNAHPLENTATTSVSREDALRFIRACGHEARIVDLEAGATG
jgi:Ala-tRNA(Pro) deacylase